MLFRDSYQTLTIDFQFCFIFYHCIFVQNDIDISLMDSAVLEQTIENVTKCSDLFKGDETIQKLRN